MKVLSQNDAWVITLIILSVDLLWGLMTLIMSYLRERRGRGMSPLPPILFILYLFPVFRSQPSMLFGQSGYGPLRILESVVTFLALAAASIYVIGVLPHVLASKVAGSEPSEREQE